jgi:hypothetical protein
MWWCSMRTGTVTKGTPMAEQLPLLQEGNKAQTYLTVYRVMLVRERQIPSYEVRDYRVNGEAWRAFQ